MVARFHAWRAVLFYISYGWIIAYLLLSLFLLVYELFSIAMPFFRRQFLMLVACLAALALLYYIYCGQDPGQVYSFYSYDYLGIRGVGYMLLMPGLGGYILLVAANVIGGLLGIGMLLRYTEDTISSNEDDPGLERKFDVARTGASVFVHGIKNQLLANRVLYKRIRAELDKPEPDMDKLRESAERLNEINDTLIARSEELYRTVKSKSVMLVPVALADVCATAADRFRKKVPGRPAGAGRAGGRAGAGGRQLPGGGAVQPAHQRLGGQRLPPGMARAPCSLIGYTVRLYTVLEVRDDGEGIAEDTSARSSSPFIRAKTPTSTGAWASTMSAPSSAATWARCGWRTGRRAAPPFSSSCPATMAGPAGRGDSSNDEDTGRGGL